MEWDDTQIRCEVCKAWVALPSNFLPDDPRSVIYRGLSCPNCENITMICYTPGSGLAVVEPSSTYSMGSAMFGYFFPPFPMSVVPMTPEELDELSDFAIKAKQRKQAGKRGKKNKRRWKIVYKGKLNEDARNSGHPDPDRKTKKL